MEAFVVYCKVCNKQFVKYRSFHKICSDRCRQIQTERDNYGYVRKEAVKKSCAHCGTEFMTNMSRKRFCCDECAVLYNKIHRTKKETQTRICEECGKEFKTTHHAKKYCTTDCYAIVKKRREDARKSTNPRIAEHRELNNV